MCEGWRCCPSPALMLALARCTPQPEWGWCCSDQPEGPQRNPGVPEPHAAATAPFNSERDSR